MKTPFKLLLMMAALATFIWACSSNDDPAQMVDDDVSVNDDVDPTDDDPDSDDDGPVGGSFETVNVTAVIPTGSDVDLATTTLFSLASPSTVDTNGVGELPFNSGTIQLAYLLDENDNLLMAGFLTDDRKEISITTTTEVMLYFGLGFALEFDSIKTPFLNSIQQVKGFSNLVAEIESLFTDNPLMYSEGTYTNALNTKIDEITTFDTVDIANRIEVDSQDTRSGITVNDVDSQNIQIQNSYPRRAHAFVYKKAFTDEEGNETQIDNYTANPINSFELDQSRTNSGVSDSDGLTFSSRCSFALGNTDNTTTSPNINLPVSEGELSADYEVVVVGPGTGKSGSNREFTPTEQAKFEELSKEAYILDNFLPTLLDISGNKGLLPELGDPKEQELVDVVLPYLEANPSVLGSVLDNDFDSASRELIPTLYSNVVLPKDTKELFTDIYNILGDGGNPDQFIMDQELLEIHETRLKELMRTIDDNINSFDNKCSNKALGDSASLESWTVKSADGKVKVGPECLNILLNQVGDITVQTTTDLEDGQTLEYEWVTTGQFGGRIQDINGDSGNFGTSITTTEETVSFSSVALESDLGDGDNIEDVTVTAYVKNSDGSRSEVGSDQMKVNIRKRGFYLTPEDACVKGGTNVVLRLFHSNGETAIPNENTDYKLVWRTSGQYGKLSGRNTVETKYNDDSVTYTSLDTDVEEGTDEVTVDIYARPKDGSGDYQLVDDTSTSITTKNDPNVRYLTLPLKYYYYEYEGSGSCQPETGFESGVWIEIPKDENATRYSVEWGPLYAGWTQTFFNGVSVPSWTNESQDNYYIYTTEAWPEISIISPDYFYVWAIGGTGCTPCTTSCERRQTVSGTATVTIRYD